MIQSLQKHLKPSQGILGQFIKYFLVGGLSTLVHWSVFTLLTEVFDLHYLFIAQPMGFFCGLLINYTLSIHFVFNNRSIKNPWAERGLFFLTAFIGFIIDSILLYLFVDLAEIDPKIAKVLSAGITFAWNFLSKKFILFK